MHTLAPLAFLVAAPALAQAVLTVGPGQTYPDIAAAVAAATPGDVVRVTAGTYGPFTLAKGVTLRAEPIGASVVVTGAGVDTCYFELPANQTATIEGLNLRVAVVVRRPGGAGAAGAVAFTGTNVEWGMQVQDAHTVLRNCIVNGFGTALELSGAAAVTAVQCSFLGRQASWVPTPHGVKAGGAATLHLGACQVRGGTSGFHGITSVGNGVTLSGAVRSWFVDTDVAAWNQPWLPCPAVVTTSTEPVAFERGSAIDNLGNPGSFVGAVQNRLVLGVTSTDQIQVGQPFAMDFHTRPGLPVFVHATFFLQAPVAHPILTQPDWGFVPNSIFLAGMVADAQGLAPYSVGIPNLPFLQDLPLWFCGWSATDLPVQLAPVLGGVIR